MPKNQIVLRIDVDSVQDVGYLPQLLDLLERLSIPATFFITTGPDKVAFHFFKYATHPELYLKFLRSRPLRYGLQSFQGLIKTRNVEEASPSILKRVRQNHEVGLHGYDHYMWMKSLQSADDKTISRWISLGAEALEAIIGVRVRSFASPGFAVTGGMLRAIDAFGFDYSSDFRSSSPMAPFYPEIDKRIAQVLQVPVSIASIGELLGQGVKKEDILTKVQTSIDAWHGMGLPFVLFIHPAYEIGCEGRLFSSMLEELARDPRLTFRTLSQVAQQWKVHS